MTVKTIIQICLIHFCGSSLPLFGQEDLQSEFDRFVRQENTTFDNRIKQMNKEFANYLQQQWKSFDTHVNEPVLRDPDNPIIKRKGTVPAPVENKQEEIVKEILPLTPPVNESALIRPQQKKTVVFFGQSLPIPFDPSYVIQINSTDEKAIARAWLQAANVNFACLQSALLHYKKELRLNDWGFTQLVRKSVETIYGTSNLPGVPFLTTFLLNQASYSARLGKVNGRLAILLELKETIYSIPQFKCGNKILSIFSEQSLSGSARVSTYTQSFPMATNCISIQIPVLPLLQGKFLKQNLPHQWKDRTIPVEVNKNLIDFMATIPQTELQVYAQSGTSEQIHALCKLLQTHIEGKSETEAVTLLLDFIQNTFDYQSDTQQFGYEKIFFPDEMLFYPYNDCEDRAILFCRLVKLLLKLPVALVSYPNHIAAAVRFNAEITGTSYLSDSGTYTLCDPTYINAGIGECMPQFENTTAKLILL